MGAGTVPRVRFVALAMEDLAGARCGARVDMDWEGQTFVGAAEEDATELGRMRCAAQATCDCLKRVLSGQATFEILDIETVKVFDATAVVIALAVREDDHVRYSVGFCLIKENPEEATVKAVLNGTNRILAGLLPDVS